MCDVAVIDRSDLLQLPSCHTTSFFGLQEEAKKEGVRAALHNFMKEQQLSEDDYPSDQLYIEAGKQGLKAAVERYGGRAAFQDTHKTLERASEQESLLPLLLLTLF